MLSHSQLREMVRELGKVLRYMFFLAILGASLYLSRQDLGLAEKNNRRNNDTIAMSLKAMEATRQENESKYGPGRGTGLLYFGG